MAHDTISDHDKDYKSDAWRQYTVAELGQWVHLLIKCAGHRDNPAKRAKDLADARNYLAMIVANLTDAEQAL